MSIIYKNNEQILIEIKKIMLENKITQREIANKLGIKPQGLTKIMNKKNFGFEDAQKILSAIGYNLIIDFEESARVENATYKTPDARHRYITAEDEKEIDLQRLLSDSLYKREIIGKYGWDVFDRLESKAKQQLSPE